MFALSGKTALVTGGTSGIGLMAVRGLVQAGVTTYLVARDAARCAEVAADVSVYGVCRALPGDLGSSEGIRNITDAFFAREQQLNILVNNAGVMIEREIDAYSEEEWDASLNLNLKAVFFLTQRLLPALRSAATPADPGRIINIGSGHGIRISHFDHYGYSASKAGLHHLTRALARRLARDHINVNAVAPGVFPSNQTAHFSEERNARIRAALPRQRFGQEADIVGALTYLSSTAGAYVTGVVLPVDGGWSGAS